MELEKIYQAIITGRAMLITGSGAHMTALGMNGEKFPSGVALAERLYKSAGIVINCRVKEGTVCLESTERT